MNTGFESSSEDSSQESDYDVDSDAESVCSTSSGLSQPSAEPSCKVFLMKFPPSVKRIDIKNHLKTCGLSDNVRNIRIFHGKDKKSKGCGYVEVTPPSFGCKAISVLNDSLLLGKHKIAAKRFHDRKGRNTSKCRSDRQPPVTKRNPSASEERDVDVCRVFVGAQINDKLPHSIQTSHFQKHFREFQPDLQQIYVVTDKKTKQSKGYGFVDFKSKQAAVSAIKKLSGSCLHGCQLKLNFAKTRETKASCSSQGESSRRSSQSSKADMEHSPKKTEQTKTFTRAPPVKSGVDKPDMANKVFIGGLPESIQPHHLHAHFGEFHAELVKAYIPSNVEGKPHRRHGFVYFSSFESAERAVRTLNGSKLHGTTIRVQHDKHSLKAHCSVPLVASAPAFSAPSTQPALPKPSNTVCLSNLSPAIDKESIATLCEGSVAKLEVVPVDSNSSKAIITFSSLTDAEKAIIQFDKKDFLGQTISASYIHVAPDQPVQSEITHMYPVKVTQLAATVGEANICSVFKAAGEIVECKVISSTNRYALVNFKLESAAEKAVDMFNGMVIDGAKVNVSKKSPRVRKDHFSPSTGSQCQPVTVQVSNLNTEIQVNEHWKSLTDVFRPYHSAKVENVSPPHAYVAFGDVTEAHSAAEFLNQSIIGNSLVQMSVKQNQPDHQVANLPANSNGVGRPEDTQDHTADAQETTQLSSAQCNLLTAVNTAGSSLFQELVQPFRANPNVKIELLLTKVAVCFTGKQDAVESASSHFRTNLQRHVPIEMEYAEALMEIYPNLSQQMTENHGITLVGLQKGTVLLKLDGPQSGIGGARSVMDNLIASFQKLVAHSQISLTENLLISVRKQLKSEGIRVCLSHPPGSMDVTIYSFSTDDQERAQKIVCSKPSIRYVPFEPNSSLKEIPLQDIAKEFSVFVDMNEAEQKIFIKAFVRQDVLSAQERITDCVLRASVQFRPFTCSPEQMLHIRCKLESQREATLEILKRLPAQVLIETNRPLHFKGSPLDIENSQKQLLEGPLLRDLRFQTFTYFKTQYKFFLQVEQHILIPLKREHPDFEYVHSSSEEESGHRKGRRGSSSAEQSEFTVTVLSQESKAFDAAVKALEEVNPCVKTLSVRYSNALDCVREKAEGHEQQYRVHIVIPKDSNKVLIFGLTEKEAGQCLNDLREQIESTIVTEKFIKVDRSLAKYFQQKKSEEWKELQGMCRAFKVFDHRRQETDTVLIRVEGTVRQVRAIQQKLDAMRELDFISKVFTVSVEKRYTRIWVKHWNAIIKEKEESRDLIIEVSKKHTPGSKTDDESLRCEYVFTASGCDEIGLNEAEEELSETHTVQRIIKLSEKSTRELDKGRKEKELHVTNQYIVDMFIDFKGNRVILTAPVECSDDLESAAGEIERFIGNHTATEMEITVNDPVICLMLYSRSKSSPHLIVANQLSKPYGVSVQCLRRPRSGLRLRGTQDAIKQVEPLIHQKVIAQLQATIDEIKFPVDSSLLPFFETPEFTHFNAKLRDELCVLSTFPKLRENNKVIKSVYLQTTTSASCIKLEICKGNLTNEDVDCIVNAANEDLQHIGGLALAIVRAGGDSIQTESNQYIQKNGKLQAGNVVCLGAGNLLCKKILHAVGPRWVDGSKGEEQTLYFTVLSCLQACEREGLGSIAFPAISAGIFAVPNDVCTRASMKAIRDFCQITPHSCVTNVRFVLLQDHIADQFTSALDSDILLGCTLPTPQVDSSPTTSSTYSWEWMDDMGSFTPYDPHLISLLQNKYEQCPSGSLSFVRNKQTYVVDFSTMIQTNALTNFQRKVRQVPTTITADQGSVQWKYCNDTGRWTPYMPADSQAIEIMFQKQTPCQRTINGRVYSFDFDHMFQINVETSYKRSIKRSTNSAPKVPVPSKPLEMERRVVVTLRGPTANLPVARQRLDDKLKGVLKNGDITFPASIERKVVSIMQQHKLTYTIGTTDEEDQKRMKKHLTFQGISSSVNIATSAIQEEIINYHVAAAEESAVGFPPEWQPQTQNLELCQVPSGSQEWNKIVGSMKSTLPNVTVIQVIRVQNKWLWERYAQHKQRLAYKNDGMVNERELFHGTRSNNPKLIYEGEDGFDMRFSSQGMWGLANYFAVNANYSDRYAYSRGDGSKEMFMVKVLTGDSYQCASESSLRMPPMKEGTGASGKLQFARVRYDTVTGATSGSQVFMTYDNDKAYPAYLIQYS